MSSIRCDAVVVGAGPAGLLTALRLAGAGLSVAVVEQREVPADGLLLLPSSVFVLVEGSAPRVRLRELEGIDTAKELALVTPRRRHTLAPATPLWAVPRRPALLRLAEAAADLGVEVLWRTRAEVPLWEEQRIAGVRCRGPRGDTLEVRSRALVDASGPDTFLAAAVGQLMPRRGRPRRELTVRGEFGARSGLCELHLVEKSWTVVTACSGGTARSVVPAEHDRPQVSALPLAGGAVPREALVILDERRRVGVRTRAQCGPGWVAVGAAAGRGAPGAPGATATGLEAAAAAAAEIAPVLRRGGTVGSGTVGATVALERQAAHLEGALARALEAAAAAGGLAWAVGHPTRARCLAGMLLGAWSGRRDRLRRYFVLWRLGRIARRVQ